MTDPFVYVDSPTGVIHLTTDRRILMRDPRAVCGKRIGKGWVFGDESLSGFRATCRGCQTHVNRRFNYWIGEP